MGEEIFRHADKDGDVIRLERATTANPLLRAYVDSENEFALLDRDAVLSLVQALTEWAYPTHTPEGPNRSLIEELIAKAVKDQVSAVLPLHLSPVSRCDGTDCCTPHPVDPEPSDVGHPRPATATAGPCGESMGAGQRLSEPHDACGFIWALHKADPPQACSTYRAPLPVREKTVIVPECGLCKRPWSDGHGQPGDPCPGVEAARGDVGDWTDALWRVRPSAPANESRYCDECGHSWESHWESLGRCVSAVGKGKCGCTRRLK